MKPAHRKGSEARTSFEGTMRKLFRVSKSEVKKPNPKKKAESEK